MARSWWCAWSPGASFRTARATSTRARARNSRPMHRAPATSRRWRPGSRWPASPMCCRAALLDDLADPDAVELRTGFALDAAHRLGVGGLVLADHAHAVGRQHAALPGRLV